jgi:small-conductance mechanosensitive channel
MHRGLEFLMPFPFLAHLRQYSLLNMNPQDLALAAMSTILATAVMYSARAFVMRRFDRLGQRRPGKIDHLVTTMLSRTYVTPILLFALYFGSTFLPLNQRQALFVNRIALGALLLQLAIWGDTGLRAWRDQYRFGGDGTRLASSSVLCFISRLTLWMIVTLMVLDNFGINITTLVASLGVGGVAVALATQNILGDLFASLSIMLDKPFEVGDFIIVGEVLGAVEHIGLKTTRVRGLGGEQVVFSNGDLLKSRIHNHKRMQTRRVAFTLRVAYGISEERLCRVPRLIRDIITAKPNVDFERAHFMGWGEWSLDFEVVYHFRSPDYILHMDTQQDIFLEIYRRFEQESLPFAHPMSIIHMADKDRSVFAQNARPGPAAPDAALH